MANNRFFPLTTLGKLLVLVGSIFSIITAYFYADDFVQWIRSSDSKIVASNNKVDDALAKAILVILTFFWILIILGVFIFPLLFVRKRSTLLIVTVIWIIFTLIPTVLLILNIIAQGGIEVDKTVLAIVSTITAMGTLIIFVGSILIIISISKLDPNSKISLLGKTTE